MLIKPWNLHEVNLVISWKDSLQNLAVRQDNKMKKKMKLQTLGLEGQGSHTLRESLDIPGEGLLGKLYLNFSS